MTRISMAITAALFALAASSAAHAAVPSRIAVTLNGSDDAGPLEGDVEVAIRIFDAGSAGVLVYEEANTVTAQDGLMYVELGGNGGGPLDESVFDGGDRWIEVSIDGTAMSPRLRVGVVPYAVAAATADSCDMLGDLAPGDVARFDHDHAGAYLPSGSTLMCPNGFVTGIDPGTGNVTCGTAPAGETYSAAPNGGLSLNANNGFFIAVGGVTSAHIATGAVASSDVLDNSLTAADLGANSVGTSEVINDSLTRDDLGPGSVGSSEVFDNSLTQADLAAGSVGSSEVFDNSLTQDDLATGSVRSDEVFDNSLTANDLATNSVGADEIAAGAVNASEIANGAVRRNHRVYGSPTPIVSSCGTFVAATICPVGDGIGACGGSMIDCDQGPALGGFCEYDGGCTALDSNLNNCGDCEIYVRIN